MTEVQKQTIHEQILEIEDGLAKLIKKAEALSPYRKGHKQQKAILKFQKSIRGLAGWELGQLKNAFDMNDKDFKIKPDEKLRREIDDLAKRC